MARWLLLVLFCAPTWAHTLGVAGGVVAVGGDGSVEVRLDLPPGCLPLFLGPAGTPGEPPTSALVRDVLADGFVLRAGNQRRVPDTVDVPTFAGTHGPVAVRVRWHAVPAGTWTVVDVLDDLGLTIVLDRHTVTMGPGSVPPRMDSPPDLMTTVFQALVLGVAHIIPKGLDHILFILGLYAGARRWRDLLSQITAFTVAHCLTLGLAMGGVIILGPRWSALVEIAIAASIVTVAVENCWRPQAPGWRRLALVTLFGLVHGLGFAGALSQVAWPEGRFLPALVAANLGIELGQLVVVGIAALATAWWWSQPWYQRRVGLPLSLLLGLTGAWWTVQRVVGTWS